VVRLLVGDDDQAIRNITESITNQFENGITFGNCKKSFGRGFGGNGKVALHFAFETVEVGFQDLWLVCV